jgi:hypothetical protein
MFKFIKCSNLKKYLKVLRKKNEKKKENEKPENQEKTKEKTMKKKKTHLPPR